MAFQHTECVRWISIGKVSKLGFGQVDCVDIPAFVFNQGGFCCAQSCKSPAGAEVHLIFGTGDIATVARIVFVGKLFCLKRLDAVMSQCFGNAGRNIRNFNEAVFGNT
jgi:hypothetical protein